jgi:CRP-like cAMP-binding protein
VAACAPAVVGKRPTDSPSKPCGSQSGQSPDHPKADHQGTARSSLPARTAELVDATLVELANVCDWPAHTVLARSGELVRSVLIVVAGAITLTRERGGLRVLLGVRGPGSVLGAESVLCCAHHAATLTSLSPCSIGSISPASFTRLLATDAQARTATMRALARHASESMRATWQLTTCRAQQKLAWILIDVMDKCALHRQDGASMLPFRLTVTDLAAIAGVERETASRVTSYFIGRRWLTKENGRLVAPAGSPLGPRSGADVTVPGSHLDRATPSAAGRASSC